MPSEAEKGTIQPLDMAKLPLIAWRLRNVAEPRSRLLLTGMYTCAKMPLVVTTLSLMNIH